MDCPACKKKISPSISSCPHCFSELDKRESGNLEGTRGHKGRRRKRNSDKILLWGVVGVLSAGLVGAGWWAVTPLRQKHSRSRAVQNGTVVTASILYEEVQASYSAGRFGDAVSKARLALNLAGGEDSDTQDALEIPLRELLARSYAVGALLQWRMLCRLAPDQPKYQLKVAELASQFNSIGLNVAAGDLMQAEELFRKGQQQEGIRRGRLALELYKAHGGSKPDIAHAEAALGQMLWIRREVARARGCLERAALLGYSDPKFLKVLQESRRDHGGTASVISGDDAWLGPSLDERVTYPRYRPTKDSDRSPATGVGAPPHPVAVNAGVRPGPHKDQPRVVLPSVQVPDSMVRGGGLPTYDRPNGGGDILPSYRGASITGDGPPGYHSSAGVRPSSDRLPTY